MECFYNETAILIQNKLQVIFEDEWPNIFDLTTVIFHVTHLGLTDVVFHILKFISPIFS